MTRHFLKSLGIESAENIDAIMDEHSKGIGAEKRKYEAEKERADTAENKLTGYNGVDVVKLQEENKRLTADLDTAQKTHASELQAIKNQTAMESYCASKQFVNVETRAAYVSKMLAAVADETNKGKTHDELFAAMTTAEDGTPRTDIFLPQQSKNNILPPMPPVGNVPIGMTLPTQKLNQFRIIGK